MSAPVAGAGLLGNEFGGQDYSGAAGFCRWACEGDGEPRRIFSFTRHGAMIWEVSVSAAAPEAIFAAAWQAARNEADQGPTP